MRLRKPCEHDRYDEHVIWNGGAGKPVCPGGEFLPEDALVIEKVDGEWPEWAREIKSYYSEAFYDADRTLTPKSMLTILDDLLATDQVGEPG